MKILYIHNEYARASGEEQASGDIVALLREHGHEVRWFKRSSAEISCGLGGSVKAFFAGIYNPYSARELANVLDEYKPDIVQVQNLYPLLSSSIFAPLRKRNIPTVMRCPNYRLFCPTGLCLAPSGQVCERCFSDLREWNCICRNCQHSIFKSLGYAARNAFSRLSGNILEGVDVFIVQSEFQKAKFIEQGIPAERVGILPGLSPSIDRRESEKIGEYVSFVGRVSPEKGIYEFIEASRLCPDIPFKVAGTLDSSFVMPSVLPANLEFVGFLSDEALNDFYLKSRIIVVPSKWYEGFPNVIVRAMLLQRPVITTSIGAMTSITDDGVNGLLVAPGNAQAIADAVSELWPLPERCLEMGRLGRDKALALYSRESVYDDLMDIYSRADNMVRNDINGFI